MKFSVGKHALLPADAEANDYLNGLGIGSMAELNPAAERATFKRFVFVILNRLAELDTVPKVNLRAYLPIILGYCDFVPAENQNPVIVPWSLADMKAVTFEAFWDDASAYILKMWLPPKGDNAEADDIRRAILEKR